MDIVPYANEGTTKYFPLNLVCKILPTELVVKFRMWKLFEDSVYQPSPCIMGFRPSMRLFISMLPITFQPGFLMYSLCMWMYEHGLMQLTSLRRTGWPTFVTPGFLLSLPVTYDPGSLYEAVAQLFLSPHKSTSSTSGKQFKWWTRHLQI